MAGTVAVGEQLDGGALGGAAAGRDAGGAAAAAAGGLRRRLCRDAAVGDGGPQPALLALAEAGAFRGRVLDVGCGTGEHALLAAGLGLEATGIDVAGAAIERAREKARERGLTARFLVGNAEDGDRPAYVDDLRAAVPPGGRYFLLCFSDRQPGFFGPRRITQGEISATPPGAGRPPSPGPDRRRLARHRGT